MWQKPLSTLLGETWRYLEREGCEALQQVFFGLLANIADRGIGPLFGGLKVA
jgi:hypothetical protein